jgi:hypothetical protein
MGDKSTFPPTKTTSTTSTNTHTKSTSVDFQINAEDHQISLKASTSELQSVFIVNDNLIGNFKDVILRGIGTPTGLTDATPKGYVDALINGVSWLAPALAASALDQVLSVTGAVITLDDVIISTTGTRVLLISQTNMIENGVYVFNAELETLTRAVDFADGSKMDNKAIFVSSGTIYADNALTVTSTGVIGTDDVVWTMFANINPVTVSSLGSISVLNLGHDYEVTLNADITVDKVSARTSTLMLNSVDGVDGQPGVSVILGEGQVKVNSARITSVGTPTDPTDATTKSYVDDIVTAGNSILVDKNKVSIADVISVGGSAQTTGGINADGVVTLKNSSGESKLVFNAGAIGADNALAVGPYKNEKFFVSADGDTTSFTYTATSDVRLKRCFEQIDDAKDKISKVGAFYYEWIDHPEQGRQCGVKAQEVQKILPESVRTDEKGILSVNYNMIFTLLLADHQRLSNEMEELKCEVKRSRLE